MTTGYNICPICKRKYSPKNESKLHIGNEDVCIKCYRKQKKHPKYGFTISGRDLIYYFDDKGNYETTKIRVK